MAEYERWGTRGEGADRASPYPPDFTPEDAETARWLNTLYDIDGEQLPPRYAQTLLGDPQHTPADDDFEQRTLAAVFARLALPCPAHRAPAERRMGLRDRATAWRQRIGSKVAVGVLALTMVLAYNASGTGVALASVLQLITGRGGVTQVAHYPTLTPITSAALHGGNPTVAFVPQWVGQTANGYTFMGVDVYQSRSWTQGALVVLHYSKVDNQGAHTLSFLEFKPQVNVALQVVQDGSATDVQLANSSGVFVSGRWIYAEGQPKWQAGTRGEVICHSADDPGVVIWIAADNIAPDGEEAARALLVSMANSLGVMSLDEAQQAPQGLHYMTAQPNGKKEESFNGDVVALESGTPGQQTALFRIDLLTSEEVTDVHEMQPGQW